MYNLHFCFTEIKQTPVLFKWFLVNVVLLSDFTVDLLLCFVLYCNRVQKPSASCHWECVYRTHILTWTDFDPLILSNLFSIPLCSFCRWNQKKVYIIHRLFLKHWQNLNESVSVRSILKQSVPKNKIGINSAKKWCEN